MRRTVHGALALFTSVLVFAPRGPASAQPSHGGHAPALSSDFNGDGADDLAVGASWESVHGQYAAGAVSVLYGSASGVAAAGNQFWTQDSAGIPDRAERGDNFGSTLAHGDFNGDGSAYLAVGSPYEQIGQRNGSGSITVIAGSSAGLSSTGVQLIAGMQFEDQLGYSLASGDFNGDGFADLAAGLPYRQLGSILYAGAVQIMMGSPTGLDPSSVGLLTQDTPGIPDQAEGGDEFGSAVRTGDFNGDSLSDLAASAYEEQVGEVDEAGAVIVVY